MADCTSGPNNRSHVTLRAPAEWELHKATWVAWPFNSDTWPNNLKDAQQEFVALVQLIAEGETVCVLVNHDHFGEANKQLHQGSSTQNENIQLFDISTNDAWIRDFGPTIVVDRQGNKIVIDWKYNGWGTKYPPFDDDQRVAWKLADLLKLDRVNIDAVIEGGAIEFDGNGLLMTTESCVLNNNRNPNLRRTDIESLFESCLGCGSTVWLPGEPSESTVAEFPDLPRGGLPRDDTDGHIDQIARFVGRRQIVLSVNQQETVFNETNRAALRQLNEKLDAKLEIIELPLPSVAFSGEPLPASYANFYFCNRAVIVPQFGDKYADDRAIDIIGTAVAKMDEHYVREVVGLPSLNLTWGLGSFHCLTQQEPQVVSLPGTEVSPQ